jgi:hypothetical protein
MPNPVTIHELNEALAEYYLMQSQIRTLRQQALDVWRRIAHMEHAIRKSQPTPQPHKGKHP